MRCLVLAAVCGSILGGGPVGAQEGMWRAFKSGEELLRDCRSETSESRALCRGYIMALNDVLSGFGAVVDGTRACLEGDESVEELIALVTDYLEANPGVRSINADGLVAYALALRYPCDAKRPR